MFWIFAAIMCSPLTMRIVQLRKLLYMSDMRMRDWRVQTYTGRVMECRETTEVKGKHKYVVSHIELMTTGGVVQVSIPDFLICVFDRQTITICEAVKQSKRNYFAILNHDTKLVAVNDKALYEIAKCKMDWLLVLWIAMTSVSIVGIPLLLVYKTMERRQRINYTKINSDCIPLLWTQGEIDSARLGYVDILV